MLGELIHTIVDDCERRRIKCLGIGERLHGTGVYEFIFIPHLIPALAKAGYKNLISEYIFSDTQHELESLYSVLDDWKQYPVDEKITRLDKILRETRAYPILTYNYELLLSGSYKENILRLIIAAHLYGIEIYGMLGSSQVRNDQFVRAQLIADGGRAQMRRLKKNGKLMIYGGDMHLIAKQLQIILSDNRFKDPGNLSFGWELYNDVEVKYFHLTLLCGTEESIKKANSDPKNPNFEKGGYQYYLDRFSGLKPGMARYDFVEQEGERRGLLVYNNSNG